MPIPQMQRPVSFKSRPIGRIIKTNRPGYLSKVPLLNRIHFFKYLTIRKTLKIIAILFAIFCIYVVIITWNLPNPNQLIDRQVAQSTKIYDRTGENIIYEIHGDQKRTLIQIKDLPDYVKQATVAVEDKNFYKHQGVSVTAILRTIATDIIYRRTAGGSTLTQQFVKNAVLSSEKTIPRKIKEIVLAQRIEKKFTKEEILQMYLNEIPYGSNAYGVEAASQKYFTKAARDLTLAEAALLAALPQAPSRYSPYGSNKDILIGRQQYILDLMVEQGYVTSDQASAAKKQELKFAKPNVAQIAPHFVMYLKDQLTEKYGEQTVEQGGLKIYSTLDLPKQKIAEEAIKTKTENYQTKYNASNAALISLDPRTGQILAMVGSRDFFDDSIDGQVNITTANRQPGSSIKPMVYATLFLKGYTPNTILYDVVTNFAGSGKAYEPRDYDNKERGPVTIRKALAGSLNVPAVKALYLAGVDNVIKLAKDLGYTTLTDPDRYGLSLVLGGGEVKLLEHANAFSVFATDGDVSAITGILKVEDRDGKVLEEYKENKKTVLPSNVARMITAILSDNSARSYVFGIKNYLVLGDRPVAAKTGTTNDFKDAWTMGFTPSLVTGVWVGNNSGKAMKSGADGSVVAAPIWNEYMKKSLANTPVEGFNAPDIPKTNKAILDGTINFQEMINIDSRDGSIANDQTPLDMITQKVVSNFHDILYYVDKNDPLGPAPTDPSADPQFSLWESRVQAWAEKYGNTNIDVGTFKEGQGVPEIILNKPIIVSSDISAELILSRENTNLTVEYFINDISINKTTSTPYELNYNANFLSNGTYNLKVRACDEFYNCREQQQSFEINVENNPITVPTAIISAPKNNSTLTKDSFPLRIKVKLSNPKQITKIEYIYSDQNNKATIITTNQGPFTNKDIDTVWQTRPNNGQYQVYAQIYDWQNKMETSNKITVTIQ